MIYSVKEDFAISLAEGYEFREIKRSLRLVTEGAHIFSELQAVKLSQSFVALASWTTTCGSHR